MPVLSDEHGVLVLRGKAAILGDDGPVIPPRAPRGVAIHEDGLHREGHAGLHGHALPVSHRHHLGLCMERLPHTMSYEVRADAQLVPLPDAMDGLQGSSRGLHWHLYGDTEVLLCC